MRALLPLLPLLLLSCSEGLKPPPGFPEGELVLRWAEAPGRVELGQPLELRLWLRTKPRFLPLLEKEEDPLAPLPELEGGRLEPEGKGVFQVLGEALWWTRGFRLQWFRLGDRSLPALSVELVEEGKTLRAETEILDFEVVGLLGETDARAEIPGSLILDAPPPSLLPWILGGLALVLVLGTGFFFLRRARGRMRPLAPVPLLDPEQEALRRQRELERRLAEGGIGGERLVVEVSAALRAWFDRGLGIRSLSRTTEEFLADLRAGKGLEVPAQGRLGSFLRSCDLVKFAAQVADLELCQGMIETARSFVLETRPSPEAKAHG